MATIIDELLERPLALDEDLRVELAERLIESTNWLPDLDPEQLATLRRRTAELESGAVEAIPAEDVFRMVRESLQQKTRGA